MKRYEGVFLLKPDLNKEILDKVLKQIHDLIVKHKGALEETKEWGKQKLAYPIKKCRESSYYLMTFTIDPEAISKIKQALGINESILRILIVRI